MAGTKRESGAGGAGGGSGRRGVHHGDLENALIAAATAMIAARGSTEVSLREVAESVGVSHTAAYRHFAAKADLLAAIAERAFARLDAEVSKAVAAAGSDAGARLRAAGLGYVAFAERHPGAFRTMFLTDLCDATRHPTVVGAAKSSFARLTSLVVDGQAQGVVRRDRDAEVLAAALWAGEHGHASLLVDAMVREGSAKGNPTPRGDRTVLVELLLRGIAPES